MVRFGIIISINILISDRLRPSIRDAFNLDSHTVGGLSERKVWLYYKTQSKD